MQRKEASSSEYVFDSREALEAATERFIEFRNDKAKMLMPQPGPALVLTLALT